MFDDDDWNRLVTQSRPGLLACWPEGCPSWVSLGDMHCTSNSLYHSDSVLHMMSYYIKESEQVMNTWMLSYMILYIIS